MTDEVFELMKRFPNSKIIPCGEVVLSEKHNISFTVKGIETKEEIVSKLLEWASRPIAKGEPYSSESSNRNWRRSLLLGLNNYLKTNFDESDIWLICDRLGNAINHEHTLQFIRSGFDIEWLKEQK